MRFLTALFAILKSKNVTLTGSERMQNRPLEILVDALKSIGADIEYLDKTGYPPLKIKGKELQISKVSLDSTSGLKDLIIFLEVHKLEINLKGKITSKPYLLEKFDLDPIKSILIIHSIIML